MDVYPSIDLKDGACVRLFQGDYSQVTVYDDDPVAVALRWQECDATILHVVDLDGAATGAQTNLPVIEKIVRALRIPVQVGGGVRSLSIVEQLFDRGVARAIFGTTAVREPEVVYSAINRWGDRIAVSIDARNGKATTDGWTASSELDAVDFAKTLTSHGLSTLIYTDIARDGTLTEPNYEAMAEMAETVHPASVVASGGVARLEHIKRLADTGVISVIVGKSLYAGTLDLIEALAWCRRPLAT